MYVCFGNANDMVIISPQANRVIAQISELDNIYGLVMSTDSSRQTPATVLGYIWISTPNSTQCKSLPNLD